MVERVVERAREPEPGDLISAYMYNWRGNRMREAMEGKVVIKGKDIPWEQGHQGLIHYYLYPKVWREVGVPYWSMFVHRIKRHSGKHRHQGGLGLFVIEGKGYTVVDGVRYDWKKDDLILLPIKPQGCEHQHFNLDPDKPSEWLALRFHPMLDATGNQLEQVEVSPDWAGALTPPGQPNV